ncbi:TPA: hypothetical protein ACGUPU_002325 [Vibrio vulnificus]
MEPWSSFATILGLISAFKAESRARDGDEYNDLVQWLADKRHKSLVEELNNNQVLSLQIKLLLNRNHEEVLASLSKLDNLLMQVASQVEGFQGIVKAIEPTIELSEQSIDILRQFESSGASKFLEVKTLNDTTYMFLDASGNLSISEPRFIEDDLEQLCRLGLLLPDYNGKGDRIFKITRLTISFLDGVKK